MICNTSQVKSLGLAALVAGSVALPASAQSVDLTVDYDSGSPSQFTLCVDYTPAPGETPDARVLLVPMLSLNSDVETTNKVTPEIAANAAALNQLLFPQFMASDLPAATIRSELANAGTLLTSSTPSVDLPIRSAVLDYYLSIFDAAPGGPANPFAPISVMTQKLDQNASGDWSIEWNPGLAGTPNGVIWSEAQVAGSNQIDMGDFARLLAAVAGGSNQMTAVQRADGTIEDLLKKHLQDLANLVLKVFAVVVSEDNGGWRFVTSEPLDLDVVLPGDGGLSAAQLEVPIYSLEATTGASFYPAQPNHWFDVELAVDSSGGYPVLNGGHFEGVFTDISGTEFEVTIAEYADDERTTGVIRVYQPHELAFGDFSIRYHPAEGGLPYALDLAHPGTPTTPVTVAQYLVVPSWWTTWPF